MAHKALGSGRQSQKNKKMKWQRAYVSWTMLMTTLNMNSNYQILNSKRLLILILDKSNYKYVCDWLFLTYCVLESRIICKDANNIFQYYMVWKVTCVCWLQLNSPLHWKSLSFRVLWLLHISLGLWTLQEHVTPHTCRDTHTCTSTHPSQVSPAGVEEKTTGSLWWL